MDDILPVIETIGQANDASEVSRWNVCKLISDAYSEFGMYERGLTEGLCSRLKKSTDSIYGMRDAENLRAMLGVEPTLSISHFTTLSRLRVKYHISDEELRDWIAFAEENDLPVRDLSEQVTHQHTEDLKELFLRRSSKVVKSVTRLYFDSEMCGVPEALRSELKKLHADIQAWIIRLGEW